MEMTFTHHPFQDSIWSALDERQLIGRLWRQPQDKLVHVYRLIAEGTPDVSLNAIATNKGALHDTFAGCSEAMRRCFNNSGSQLELTKVFGR